MRNEAPQNEKSKKKLHYWKSWSDWILAIVDSTLNFSREKTTETTTKASKLPIKVGNQKTIQKV